LDAAWHADALTLVDDVDVVVELIGGSEGIARSLVERGIAAGKHVVTANKALLAVHGNALAQAAEAAGVVLGFEAAVAGGIPVVKALREGLAGNRISRVAGILNGTCNYILTVMRTQGKEFAEVLAEAQALGYAEADPSFDIDGIDTAHKLAILAALAFGRPVDFAAVHVEGIRGVNALDISFAEELGYRIKLLGIAQETASGVEMRVHPAMVPRAALLAAVDGVFNAVLAEGDFVGEVFLQGRGAGAGPTASAVVADLIDIARGVRIPVWGAAGRQLAARPALPISEHRGAYFLRLMVVDQPGVLADVTAILRDHGVSLESMLQHGRKPGEAVPIVLVTHEVSEAAMAAAIAGIGKLEAVLAKPALIRIEPS
jgi:homoserine dehydrogenase